MKLIFLFPLFFALSCWSQVNPLQWGLVNNGESRYIDLDSNRYYKAQARKGVDIHWPAPVKSQRKVLVAILDTGIDKTHPALQGFIHRDEKECQLLEAYKKCLNEKNKNSCNQEFLDPKKPNYDPNHNGYPLDCSGWSTLSNENMGSIRGQPDFEDSEAHGTHVAGIIASYSKDLSLRGVSSNIEILPVQVLSNRPNSPMRPQSLNSSGVVIDPSEQSLPPARVLGDLVARGVIYAMNSGADVINFSMGWPQSFDSEYLREVIQKAQARGIIFVASAGNDSTSALLRPCVYPGVICVAAHGPDGSLAYFSNFGAGVDLAAPGVSILSTYPMATYAAAFAERRGFEYLSGTSQAAPFVTAAVAEMLARGVKPQEIYPRLMSSTQPLLEALPPVVGMPHEEPRVVNMVNLKDNKFIRSGRMDLTQALAMSPVPVILPLNKEKEIIQWDRRSRDIQLNFKMKNYWAPLSLSQLKIAAAHTQYWSAQTLKINNTICNFGGLQNWITEQEISCSVKLEIIDTPEASESRLPSSLALEILVSYPGVQNFRRVVEADILVPVTKDLSGPDIQVIPFKSPLISGGRLIPIDENLDGAADSRDYLMVSKDPNEWSLAVVKQQPQGYQASDVKKLAVDGKPTELRDQFLTRLGQDERGLSQYALGLFVSKEKSQEEDEEEVQSPPRSVVDFYFFDENLQQIEKKRYESVTTFMPYQISWHKIGSRLHPAWVGPGPEVVEKLSLRDLRENPPDPENPLKGKKIEIRFFYLDENFKLKTVKAPEGYNIVDILQGSVEQTRRGVVPVLLAQNRGTEVKPSYLFNFATAEIYQGQLSEVKKVDFFRAGGVYRNLLDSRVDKIHNLDKSENEFAGTFWDGELVSGSLRLSALENQKSQSQANFFSQALGTDRFPYDAVLRVRSVYSGAKRKGAFAITNSEIQYHDLLRGTFVKHSLERYTFNGEMATTNLQFPVVVQDAHSVESKLPALFTTEGSGLSRGLRLLVPVIGSDQRLLGLISPAKMRFYSERQKGCRPLETPVFLGGAKAYGFDYYCGDRILRVNLKF